jgi:hypothetical protein
MSSFQKTIGGQVLHRRYAYLHPTNREKYGLIDATSFKDAQRFVGRQCLVRRVWLTEQEEREQAFSPDRKWEIVSLTFGSVSK